MFNREHVTDALRFWELARIPYNLALLAVTIGAAFVERSQCDDCYPVAASQVLTVGWWAVMANIAYSTVYLVDLFVQSSDFRPMRLYWRSAIWLVGTAFASYIAWPIASVVFYPF